MYNPFENEESIITSTASVPTLEELMEQEEEITRQSGFNVPLNNWG